MKKLLLAILVVSAITATSCKKDAETSPSKSGQVQKVNSGSNTEVDKSNVSSWD